MQIKKYADLVRRLSVPSNHEIMCVELEVSETGTHWMYAKQDKELTFAGTCADATGLSFLGSTPYIKRWSMRMFTRTIGENEQTQKCKHQVYANQSQESPATQFPNQRVPPKTNEILFMCLQSRMFFCTFVMKIAFKLCSWRLASAGERWKCHMELPKIAAEGASAVASPLSLSLTRIAHQQGNEDPWFQIRQSSSSLCAAAQPNKSCLCEFLSVLKVAMFANVAHLYSRGDSRALSS
jgi:hypothetical protein